MALIISIFGSVLNGFFLIQAVIRPAFYAYATS
jgi:hypothetical protein